MGVLALWTCLSILLDDSTPANGSSKGCRVELVDGSHILGTVHQFQASAMKVIRSDSKNGPTTVPYEQILRVDCAPANRTPTALRVRMVEGTEFGCDEMIAGKQEVTFKRGSESLTVPLAGVAAILTSKLPNEWADWRAQAPLPRRSDRIVLARENRRLVLDGTLGAIGPEKVIFTLDGDDLPINRDRLRACYFAHQKSDFVPLAVITDRDGNTWFAKEVVWSDGVEARTPSGIVRRVPLANLASINFAAARMTYLSDVEPVIMSHTPAFDRAWPILRDRNSAGTEIQLDGKPYSKGLVVHSRTHVEYTLGGNFSRFQTVVGLEAHAGPLGDCQARIVADGQEVWSRRLKAGDRPIAVSLEMGRVKQLRLEVDFGNGLDAGDHVAFADARVIK